MASSFNLLTAGGARFDTSKYKHDIELFDSFAKSSRSKGKERQQTQPSTCAPNLFNDSSLQPVSKDKLRLHLDIESGSDSSSSSSSTISRPAPLKQKITLTGPSPLPKSIHANLPSLFPASTSWTAGAPLLLALRTAGIHSLWGVQCSVAGCLLEGRDTMCVAPTGSGKTLAYLLPTIVKLGDPARSLREREFGLGIRAVVLVPTHDLAVQIYAVTQTVTKGRPWRCILLSKATERAVCDSSPGKKIKVEEGEVSREDNKLGELDDHRSACHSRPYVPTAVLKERILKTMLSYPLGIDILIATPERLHRLVDQGGLSLASTRYLILDESDRLLSSDFHLQVEPIVKACSHSDIQKCLLSATMPAGAEEIAKRWLRNDCVRVVVGIKDSAVTTVSQSLLYAGSESGKILALRNLIASGDLPYPSLIFVQSVTRAEELYKTLVMDGMRVEVVHGNRSKGKRDEAVKAFRDGHVWMLVVTEVLARGMDFRGVKVVLNYDFPQTVSSYIHRIGRTGRAGRPGKSITFFSDEDRPYLRTVANVLRASGCPVAQYMLDMPKPSKNLKRKIAKVPVKRKDVGGGGRDVGKEMARRKREMVEGSKKRTMVDKGDERGQEKVDT